MGYLLFDNRVQTLQTGFSPVAPQFLLQGTDFLSFGLKWAIIERVPTDGFFTPMEQIDIVPVSASLTFNLSEVRAGTFLGAVDINRDGAFDGVAVRSLGATTVLTDLRAFINFQPFLTTVTAVSVSVPSISAPPHPLRLPLRLPRTCRRPGTTA
jgi:hypothetical protein